MCRDEHKGCELFWRNLMWAVAIQGVPEPHVTLRGLTGLTPDDFGRVRVQLSVLMSIRIRSNNAMNQDCFFFLKIFALKGL